MKNSITRLTDFIKHAATNFKPENVVIGDITGFCDEYRATQTIKIADNGPHGDLFLEVTLSVFEHNDTLKHDCYLGFHTCEGLIEKNEVPLGNSGSITDFINENVGVYGITTDGKVALERFIDDVQPLLTSITATSN